MLRPVDAYPLQIEPATSADYPHGQARNDTVPGDRLGTPWVAKQLNDIYGFFQGLVTQAGITPSGNVETAQASDLVDSILAIRVIQPGEIGATELATGAVHIPELNTSSGNVGTGSPTGLLLALPGGSHGFYPQMESTGTAMEAKIAQHPSLFSLATVIWISATGGTATAHQEYMNSSPPYNMGDGDIPLFHFGLLRDGVILATYTADVPPWAYNGPTSVTYDQMDKNGTKYKKVRTVDKDCGKVIVELQEITHEVKNADMGLIPHPFLSMEPGDQVILLDPPDTQDLLEMHEAGESIRALFDDGYLRLDNSNISRKTPNGVKPVKYKWKNSK